MKVLLTSEELNYPGWLPKAEAIYTADCVSALAEKHSVSGSQIDEFGQRLRSSAAVYLDMKDRASELEIWKAREKALAEVANVAKQLQSAIDALDERSAELFWQSTQFKPLPQATEAGQTGPLGQTVRRIDRPDGSYALIRLRPEDILEAVAIVANPDRALQLVRHPLKTGLASSPLGLWVTNMYGVWTRLLGKKFTFSTSGGVGTSRAFLFCKDVMTLLDPTVKESELQTAIREERECARRHGNPKTGKNRH
jgi:hypothetical protein